MREKCQKLGNRNLTPMMHLVASTEDIVTTRHHGCSMLRDVAFYLQSVNNIQFVLSGLLSRRLYWMPRLLDTALAQSKKVRKKDRRP